MGDVYIVIGRGHPSAYIGGSGDGGRRPLSEAKWHVWSVPRTAAMGVPSDTSRWPLLPAPGGGTHALAGSPRTTRMKRFLVVAL